MRTAACLAVAALMLASSLVAAADGPKDNIPVDVRPIPPVGVAVPAADRKAMEEGLAAIDATVVELGRRQHAGMARFLPDVRIYTDAVRGALAHREFFNARDIPKAKALLQEGKSRADSLLDGKAPWTTQLGLVVRGYVSKIDGSVQPYGLVVPASYTEKAAGKYRLDVWFHGRGETTTELNFLHDRRTNLGEFAPADTIVLHPFGRYCNAFKFAGEVDVLEAIESVSRQYRVDEERVAVRGFSMGGAAAWQFAVHHADRWFAANPGAGFAETPRFLNVFQRETLKPTWYEQSLWNLYDCDKVAANLRQVPTVAYSGELDPQKQAADLMAEALKAEGVALTHVIGPKTKHQYTADARREVDRRLASLAIAGRDRTPQDLHFVAYTLKYNRTNWLTVDAMGRHWAEARVDARILSGGPGGTDVLTLKPTYVELRTSNVAALTLDFPPGTSPFRAARGAGGAMVVIDGQPMVGPLPASDDSWRAHFVRSGAAWAPAGSPPTGLVKRHDLQGPIDDAFMDSFLIVRPTGKARSAKFAAWSKAEMERAIEHWRRQFRGEARVKDDGAVDDADIAGSNLVLWGDPESNSVLKRLADRLPISWKGDKVVVGDRSFPAEDHAPVAIYPNPLNPGRYVVLNSGFTYREYDYLNNARQVPKLPDWAIVDLKTPPDARSPGRVVAADFFGEHWEVRPPRAE